MKNSTKYILILAAALLIVMLIFMVSLRGIVKEYLVIEESENSVGKFSFHQDTDKTEKVFDIENFNSIKMEGAWDVLIIKDDEFSVSGYFSAKDEQESRVEKSGDQLLLAIKPPYNTNSGISMTIHMPDLNLLDVEGIANANFEGFDLDELRVVVAGAANVHGEDSRIKELRLESEGAVNVDLKRCEIVNADVTLDGAGNVEINMDGGSLSGRISGLGRLEYSGDVRRLDVEKDGLGSIKQRDEEDDTRD